MGPPLNPLINTSSFSPVLLGPLASITYEATFLTASIARAGSDASDQVLLKYKYDYASNITWWFDDKMQPDHSRNWSQKYTYDTLHQQGQVGGTWPTSLTLSNITPTCIRDDF